MFKENCFQGKTVMVTGSGRGIGKALTLKLDSLGAKVYAVSRNPANLAALKEECPRVQIVTADLNDWAATRAAIEKVERVDILVNNAGVCTPDNFMTMTPKVFDETCNVNLKAVINISQVVAQKMIEAGKGGNIVNISSMAGVRPIPNLSAYSTLKAGLDHLTKIMAMELGPHKIRVNSVNPGTVETDMLVGIMEQTMPKDGADTAQLYANFMARVPIGRAIVGMDEVINTILFFVSDLAPVITGTVNPVDGGYCAT